MPTFHSRNYSFLLLSLCFAGSFAAPDETPQEAITRCARIASVGDRILCLENALRKASVDAPDPAGTVEAESVALYETPVAVQPIGKPEANAGALAETAEGAAATSATAAEPTDAETKQGETDASDIGAEQLERRNQTREERIAALESAENLRVASYDVVPFQRLVVELENGQVWRQIKGDVQRIRVNLDRNQTVDIAESSFGGYQLRLNEIRRTIRVERIK